MGPKKKGFLQEKLSALNQIVSAVGEVVSSAGELLVDADLRRKGAQYIVQEASRGINEAQRGLEASADALGRTIQQGAKARFGAGARQLQAVLRNIERQVQEFQRQQQQHDLESELEHHHKLPVDVQIGDQVLEEMPQEMRSRFWYVLLERPDLATQLMGRSVSRANTPVVPDPLATAQSSSSVLNRQRSSSNSQLPIQQHHSEIVQPTESNNQPDAVVIENSATAAAAAATSPAGSPGAGLSASSSAAVGSPFAAFSSNADLPEATGHHAAEQQQHSGDEPVCSTHTDTAAAAAAGGAAGTSEATQTDAAEASMPDIDDLLLQPSSSGTAAADAGPPADAAVSAAVSTSARLDQAANAAAPTEPEAAAAAVLPRAPSPWTSGHNVTSVDPPVTAVDPADQAFLCLECPVAPNPWQRSAGSGEGASVHAAPAATSDDAAVAAAAADAAASPSPGPATPPTPAAAAAPAGGSVQPVDAGGPAATLSGAEGEGWEMVSRDVPTAKAGSTGDLEALETVRTLVESMSEEHDLDAKRAARQAVFQAMLEVPWVAGEGIPDNPTDGTEYAELLEAGCGTVEEVILRDVPRTFPEHPLFSTPAGQQRLLRVLKAYAAADPEVGYCQGMAFAAGVLLMYLPEEPAFRLFRRIMSPGGPNLRRYYLPGLDYLKLELSSFELLLSSHQPQLHQHLLDAGLPALLYAAQWFMTTFSCPFPIHVAARVLDVLLQSDSDAMLPRLGLAVMEALSSKLLELDDFEELITYIKVKPLSWPHHMHRKVFAAALSGATEAELQAATAAAREEFARSGRLASFSNRHLARQATSGGTTRHELVPGPMGPKPLAAAEAAAAAADDGLEGAGRCHAPDSSGSSSEQPGPGSSDGDGGSMSTHARASSSRPQHHDGVLVGPSNSGIVVDKLDALEDLITDLDLLLPGGTSETDSELGCPASELLVPGQQQRQQQQPQQPQQLAPSEGQQQQQQ